MGLARPDRLFFEGEVRAFNESLFRSLSHAVWTNDRDAERHASNKVEQLQAAARHGLRVPRTLVTNEPDEARAFAASIWSTGGQLAFKPISGYSPRPDIFAREASETYASHLKSPAETPEPEETMRVVFTQLLHEGDLGRLDAHLPLCPVQFQEYIPKRLEYRVTVVGDDLFSCAIQSQEYAETAIDFRRFVIAGSEVKPTHAAACLPSDTKEKVFLTMKDLGLNFGCIDMIETPDGELVFLEVNPSGQWLWVEMHTDEPITRTLTEHLVRAG